ncbi:Cysteine protease ATG4A [Thelohanellus kitauei]|uniref:Cysteine protease n=1 Tax=Thelohanellus kitauei TaxID=669202 RepID=A0A0C2M7L8_THEKT|nr:Cysteine protease ATG4A [Thelohanellus kitauei]
MCSLLSSTSVNCYIIFGEQITAKKKDLIDNVIRKLIWITYRKKFESLLPELEITTDKGWGCSIRSSQMLIANIFLNIHLHNDGKRIIKEINIQSYRLKVLENFYDKPECLLSFHRIVQIMNQSKFCIGQYSSFISPLLAIKTIKSQLPISKPNTTHNP